MPGFLYRIRSGLDRANIRSLWALRALGNFELNLLAFVQGFETRAFDFVGMGEYVLAAVGWGNETITFGVIKPFNGSSNSFRHPTFLNKQIN